jgi:LysM repeat protein
LAAFAALGLATWWLTRPRYAWVILVDGKPVAAVASREQANEVLDSLKRQAAGPLARAAHFREKVTLERVSAADQPVLSRWRAQELVGKRVQVGIPAYQLSVNDKPVLSLRSLAEVRRALEKVVKHQVPSGWRPLGTPRIVERLTVEEAWLAPEQARRQLVSVSRAAERLLSPAVPAREYVVKKGDVAARLARRHGITLADLQSANPGMDLNRLREGDRLVIAGSRPLVSVTVQAQTDTTAPVNFWTETVRSASVPPGQRRVIQRGRPGQQRVRVAATFVNGREISRRTLWGEMASEPVPERVMVGPGARSAERSRRHPRTVRGE